MEPLTTITRVSARASESIESAEEIALANEMILEATGQVRFYGLPWATMAAAPAIATDICTAAAARGYQNPSGLDKERGDSVTFERNSDYSQGASLSRSEIAILKTFSAGQGIISVGMVNADSIIPRSRGNHRRHAEYSPMESGTKPFPMGSGL